MKKKEGGLNDFLSIIRDHVDACGVVRIKDIADLFPGKSAAYTSSCMNALKKEGMAEMIIRGKWLIPSLVKNNESKDKEPSLNNGAASLPVLVLTPEEKNLLDLLIEVQTKCTDRRGGSRFNQGGVDDVLEKSGIPPQEWLALQDKLLKINVIRKSGVGNKGQIFGLNDDLLLRYLTDESLIKVTLWREEKVRDRLQAKISDLKDRVRQIAELEKEIRDNLSDLERARADVSLFEAQDSYLQKKLREDFPDKDKVLSFQELLKGIEHLGERVMLSFFKEILE